MLFEIVVEIIEERNDHKKLVIEIIKNVSKVYCRNVCLHYHSDPDTHFKRSHMDFVYYLNFLFEREIAPSYDQVRLFLL